MQKWVNIAAIGLSVIALALSALTHHEADARAEQALRRREKALVDRYKPAVDRLCREFGVKDTPQNPETLDELFRPLGKLLAGLSK